MSKQKELFERLTREARSNYVDELTDVAWLALKEVGFVLTHRGDEWNALRDVINMVVK